MEASSWAKGMAVSMVGDSSIPSPSGGGRGGEQGVDHVPDGAVGGRSGHGKGQRHGIQVTNTGFLRMKETVLRDKQERQVNKLEADELEIVWALPRALSQAEGS